MKKILFARVMFVAALVLLAAVSQAQEINVSYELLRSDVKAKKIQILTRAMNLDDAQAALFWPIYRRYEAELGKINDDKIALLKEYAQRYEVMTDRNAAEMMKKILDTEERTTQLRTKYFKKFSKALSARTAARALQVENYLNRLIDLSIAGEVPLVPRPEDIKPAGAAEGGASPSLSGK